MMDDKVKYFRWDVSLKIDASSLKELAEEISMEKRMPVEDVEREIIQLVQVRKNQIDQCKRRWWRMKVDLDGGYGWGGGII